MDEKWKVSVPEGVSGDWRVERFTVSEEDARFSHLRSAIGGHGQMGVDPGTYTRLMRGGTVVMSDTYSEYRDHIGAIYAAKGHVLINGLGLGMVLMMVCRKPEVTRVTVVEKSTDVLNLVSGHYNSMFPGVITFVNADALEYKPPKGEKYGAVWHDIWDDICEDNLPSMHTLHRKYGRRAEWQGSWRRDWIEYERSRRSVWT